VKFDLLLFVALLIVCPEIRATSIVLLASKTQIGIAADHKAERTNGSSLPDVCKIMHHRDFFFALAGTVSQGDSYDTRYNAMDILIRASAGLDDLDAIDQRFDQLIVAPLQTQVTYDFQHFPNWFLVQRHLKEPPALEMTVFQITPAGPVMVECVSDDVSEGIGKNWQPYHHSCKAGEGECRLTVGSQDGMKEYLDEHPFTDDLAADAQRLVEFEALRRPKDVGGRITVLLIDNTGVHPADTRDKCPVEWRSKPPATH
jgi:hypothetical protein